MDILDAKNKFDVPEGILDDEFKLIWHRLENAKKENKLDEDDKNLSEDKLKERYKKIAFRRVKLAILMQHIDGKLVRDMNEKAIQKISSEIGKIVGLLHKNGIMHGDLTTSNFILSKKKLVLIDFGLATRTEKPDDHAVDLRLFKEILNSAHAKIMEESWKNFQKGYSKSVGAKYTKKILKLVAVIESRGRYATVV